MRLFIILFLTILLGCASSSFMPKPTPTPSATPKETKQLSSDEEFEKTLRDAQLQGLAMLDKDLKKALEFLKDVETVSTYRSDTKVISLYEKRKGFSQDGYFFETKGPIKGKEFAEKILNYISDRANLTYSPKLCLFHPDTFFKMQKNDAYMYISICFTCRQMAFSPSSKNVGQTSPIHDIVNYTQLLEIAQEAFPTSKALKAFAKREKALNEKH